MLHDVLKTIATYLLKCALVVILIAFPMVILYGLVIPKIHSSVLKYLFSLLTLALSGTLIYMLGKVFYNKKLDD